MLSKNAKTYVNEITSVYKTVIKCSISVSYFEIYIYIFVEYYMLIISNLPRGQLSVGLRKMCDCSNSTSATYRPARETLYPSC